MSPASAAGARPRRMSLRARLSISLGVMILLGFGAFGYYTVELERRVLEERLVHQGRAVAGALSSAAVDPLIKETFPELLELLSEVASDRQVAYAMLVDGAGRILAADEAGRVGEQLPAEPPVLRALMRDDRGARADLIESAGLRVYEFREPVTISDGGRPLATLVLGYPASALEIPLARTRGRLLMGLAIALLLMILLATVLAAGITHPLRRVADAVTAFRTGKTEEVMGLPEDGPREVEQLTTAFAEMRERVRQQLAQLEETNVALDRRVRELAVLYRVSEQMNFRGWSKDLLELILEEAISAVGARRGSLMLIEDGLLRVEVAGGEAPPTLPGARLRLGEGVAGRVIATREPLIVNDAQNDPRFQEWEGEGSGSVRNLLCVPLLADRRATGVINIVNKKAPGPEDTGEDGLFDEQDANLMLALASQAARTLENARLYDASITDGLTGLRVAAYFHARLNEELRVARRYQKEVALILLDLDHFKSINDRFGHPVGDRVLRGLAECIRNEIRTDVDIAARYGGEEFAIILPEQGVEGAHALADRLRVRVAALEFEVRGPADADGERVVEQFSVTLSAGVAGYPGQAADAEALVDAADAALYAAKESGRDRVEIAAVRGVHTTV